MTLLRSYHDILKHGYNWLGICVRSATVPCASRIRIVDTFVPPSGRLYLRNVLGRARSHFDTRIRGWIAHFLHSTALALRHGFVRETEVRNAHLAFVCSWSTVGLHVQ